ncbi:xanthine/uracil permease [Auriculariales sp. MPI-PUGE-AT-0066]|nr:xanthine/uracil permease [Auriculariales sp. MPI-PUGE-AT-0066]
MSRFRDALNTKVAQSPLGRWFKLDGSGHAKERKGSKFTTEILAGSVTFASMAYIISVNASIVTDSAGTCDPTAPDFNSCLLTLRRDLITATASVSALSSFLMGALANLPVGLAPGLGLNAYFTYSVVGFYGSGMISYREALAAVFLEGWIFFILSLLGLRQWLARIIPQSLVAGTAAGIGMFIAFIGLQSGGLNVIGGNTATLVGLGGCPADSYLPDLPNYCGSHVLQSPTVWLGVFVGGIFTVFLMLYRIKGAILIGIILTSIISWPRPTSVTYFPHTEAGDAAFDFFKKVVAFHPLQTTGNALDYNYGKGKVWYALITFLYVDIMDTTGTLYSMAKFAGLRDPVTHDFEGSTIAYCVDAFSISMGALMGVSPVTAYVESATGISAGGKTGITAITTGILFFISIFFAPIFASIPPWATGGALVIVGALMARNLLEVNWHYIGDAVPAFLAVMIIPLSYNIAYGLIAGIISYVLLNGTVWALRKATGGRVSPPDYDEGEKWEIPPGGVVPFWMKRAARGDTRFWMERSPEVIAPAANEPEYEKQESISEKGSMHDEELHVHEGEERKPAVVVE